MLVVLWKVAKLTYLSQIPILCAQIGVLVYLCSAMTKLVLMSHSHHHLRRGAPKFQERVTSPLDTIKLCFTTREVKIVERQIRARGSSRRWQGDEDFRNQTHL